MRSSSALLRRFASLSLVAALATPASLAAAAALAASATLALPTTALATGRPIAPDLATAEEIAAAKLARTNATIPVGFAPFYTAGGVWTTTDLPHWNSGFLPGSLWYEYQRTGNAAFATAARVRQAKLSPLVTYTGTPDIACVTLNSHVRAYRLTGDATSRTLALTAAATLARRYSKPIGMLRAHGTGSDFRTIVDQLMNAELLFWAAENGGDTTWRAMAASNAVRTAADFQRADGSTYHFATYNTTTGKLLDRGTLAGLAKESTWSRGQAWFIYGMAAGFRETGDVRLLSAARKAVQYWATHVPADGVPYWDFDDPAIPAAPRDSSAAAIAASGLLELAALDPEPSRRAEYTRLAERTLSSLSSSAYLDSSPAGASVLLHGTYSQTRGFADTGTIWGDYFFREALMRLGTRVHRVDGTDHYATAVRASQLAFPTSQVAVLVSGEKYADGLSASSIAGLFHAPILITRTRTIPRTVLAEMSRLGVRRVIVVGGAGSVGTEVVSAVKRLPGVSVERIGGADRYEVAARVAVRVLADPEASGRVFITRGDIFPDALAVSPLAWSTRSPVLLTRPAALPPVTRSALVSRRITAVTIVGGTGSVSKATAGTIRSVTRRTPSRVAGRDRYAVATALADWAVASGLSSGATAAITTGADFPDAMTGGAATGSLGGVTLLTEARRLTPVTRSWLHARLSAKGGVTVYGDSSSVSEPVESAIDQVVTFGR